MVSEQILLKGINYTPKEVVGGKLPINMNIKNKIKKALSITMASFAIVGTAGVFSSPDCSAIPLTQETYRPTIMVSPREYYTGLIVYEVQPIIKDISTNTITYDVYDGYKDGHSTYNTWYSGPVHFAVGFEQDVIDLAGDNPVIVTGTIGYSDKNNNLWEHSSFIKTACTQNDFMAKGAIVVILKPEDYERDTNGNIHKLYNPKAYTSNHKDL